MIGYRGSAFFFSVACYGWFSCAGCDKFTSLQLIHLILFFSFPYDSVANNTPVFFIRDPTKFPHFIHTQKRDPQTHLKDPEYVLSLPLHNDIIALTYPSLFVSL